MQPYKLKLEPIPGTGFFYPRNYYGFIPQLKISKFTGSIDEILPFRIGMTPYILPNTEIIVGKKGDLPVLEYSNFPIMPKTLFGHKDWHILKSYCFPFERLSEMHISVFSNDTLELYLQGRFENDNCDEGFYQFSSIYVNTVHKITTQELDNKHSFNLIDVKFNHLLWEDRNLVKNVRWNDQYQQLEAAFDTFDWVRYGEPDVAANILKINELKAFLGLENMCDSWYESIYPYFSLLKEGGVLLEQINSWFPFIDVYSSDFKAWLASSFTAVGSPHVLIYKVSKSDLLSHPEFPLILKKLAPHIYDLTKHFVLSDPSLWLTSEF